MNDNHPALSAYRAVEQRFPNIWSLADDLRARFTLGKHWEGCIFSDAEGSTLSLRLQGVHNPDPAVHPALFGALVSWRPTKGIYRFHPALYEALTETDLDGEVPSSLLLRMPGHAVYIETPVSENMPFPIYGFFAYLSRMGKQDELQIVALLRQDERFHDERFDSLRDVTIFSLPLGNHPVSDLVRIHFERGEPDASKADTSKRKYSETDYGAKLIIEHVVSGMLSLLLYLCSEQPEIDDWTAPEPKAKFFGTKQRLIAAKATKSWDVGLRIGAALDLSSKQDRKGESDGGTGIMVRPHIRRAHWHSFWVGKRGEQTLSLRWLPPITVNTDVAENLPAVIRQVQGEYHAQS
jgi:hypothetical protein